MNKKHYIFERLRSITMMFALTAAFAAMPITAKAQSAAIIDVSTLGASAVSSSAGEYTWRYYSNELYLSDPGGQYRLVGTNDNLSISVEPTATNATIIFEDLNITCTDNQQRALYVETDCEVRLYGNNSLTESGPVNCIQILNGSTLTFAHNGALTVTSAEQAGIMLSNNDHLIVSEYASVSIVAPATQAGIRYDSGSCSIEVSQHATLNSSGGAGISNYNTSASLSLHVDGDATFSSSVSGATNGIESDALDITGTGTISATGSIGIRCNDLSITGATVTATGTTGTAVSTSNAILISDVAKLTMTNGSGTAETHTFTKLSAAVTHRWLLLDGASTSDVLTGASIVATVAAGGTGTVRRIGPIDISVFDLFNAANVAGDDAWNYDYATRVLYLRATSGAYMLTGSNPNLSINVEGADANVNLSNITMTTLGTRTAFLTSEDCTVVLTGTNSISQNVGGAGIIVEDYKSLTIAGDGSLTVTAAGQSSITLGTYAELSITETASVTTGNANLPGIHAYYNNQINIASGATLDAKGAQGGLYSNSPGPTVTLNVDGNAAFTATSYGAGIFVDYATGTLHITGTGTVSATGAGTSHASIMLANLNIDGSVTVTATGTSNKAIDTGGAILISDDAKLIMVNDDTSAETHTFTKSSTATTHQWKLTNATTTDALTLTSINGTVAAGATGVVEREVAVSTTPPTAPGAFTATGGDTQVVLTWTTPSNGGSPITKYQYSYGATAGYSASWADIPGSDATTTTYTVTGGLTNGTSYTFEVRAVNAAGNGASSGTQTATPTALTYAVTVSGAGTGATGDGSYAAGATVSIEAGTPPTGQQFKNWTTTSAGVTFANANSASTTFEMPANAVAVTANFEPIPATVTDVTVNPSTVTVQQGTSYQFSATVTGTNSPGQDVTWAVTGGIAGTSIAADGTLTVATGETAVTLTVTATSTVDITVSGIATVTVNQPVAITYTVTFNGNGGTPSEASRTVNAGAAIGTLPTASHAGSYSFTGWFTSASGGTQITATLPVNANVTYYAQWTPTGGSGGATLYTVSIGASANGSITSNKSSATAGETVTLTISPSAGYELDAITVHRTGASATTVTINGTGLTRTFTMPAYNVTIDATFSTSVTQSLWERAIAVIAAAKYNVPQSAAATEADLAAYLSDYINGLLRAAGISLTLTAADIWIQSGSFVAAAAGVNGSFTFFVLPPGVTGSALINGSIVASTVGVETQCIPSLQAWTQDGTLYVSGLSAGAEWRVYNIMGTLIYNGAPNDVETSHALPLPGRGVYIVTDGKTTIKVVN